MSRKKSTIRDVALLAGVSHQTVSRVINNYEGVNPETRQKVEHAIAELQYRPNAIARYMAKGNTCTFACIAPNLTDYAFSSLIDGAESFARENGYFLISASAPDANSFATLIEQLIDSGRTEGLLVINPYADDRHLHIPTDVPTVFMGARPRSQGYASVALNDVKGGYLATRHLLSLGHRKIGLITGPKGEDCSHDRLIGYQQALSEENIPFDPTLVYTGDWSESGGQEAIKHFNAIGVSYTALFAENDRMAIGAITQLKHQNSSVPDDISIIGFDDMPLTSFYDPPLTTIHQDIPYIGKEAVRLLIQAKNTPTMKAQHLLFDPELIIRGSTKHV